MEVSLKLDTPEQHVTEGQTVLILVLMEVSLKYCYTPSLYMIYKVLILVLMEVSLKYHRGFEGNF